MILFLIIPLILMVIFMKYIIFCDGAILGLLLGVLCGYYLHWHPAFCVILGIGCVIAAYVISAFRVSFIILSLAATAFYVMMTIEVCKSFHLDMIWTVVISVIAGVVVFGLHLMARKRVFGDDFE